MRKTYFQYDPMTGEQCGTVTSDSPPDYPHQIDLPEGTDTAGYRFDLATQTMMKETEHGLPDELHDRSGL